MTTLQERLSGLVRFLPVFEDGDISFDTYRQREAEAPTAYANGDQFFNEAYRLGWVDPQVPWIEWANTEEGQRLLTPEGIATATVEDLTRVMTTVIRQDRFVEGSLDARNRDGYLTAVLRRIRALLDSSAA